MDLPLNAFPSEDPDAGRSVASSPATRPTAATPVVVQSMASSGAIGYSRTFVESLVWREPPATSPSKPSTDRWFGLATSACTSAGVSLLTLWLWGQSPPLQNDWVPTVTVTYERLDADGAPDSTVVDSFAPAAAPAPVSALAPAFAAPAPRPNAVAISRAALSAARPELAAPPRTERAPAPAAASNRRSALVVISEPAGARVTINGVGYGSTPLTIPYLSPGAKRIRVTKQGYLTEERFMSRPSSTLKIAMQEAPDARPAQ